MITVDLRSRIPIYEQIKNKITELILLGVLVSNEQIPSIRALSKDLQINVNTVKKAYQELENDGIIYYLSGRGSFVSENAFANTSIRKKAIDNIKASIANARISGVSEDEIILIVKELYTK